MEIKLDNDWSIIENGNGYTLQKWTGRLNVDKNGKEAKVYDFQNYPPTLDRCIYHYCRQTLADTDTVVTLKEYVDQMNALYTKISTEMSVTK